MVLFRIFFLVSGFATFLSAQNYLWPTDASKLMTSSFCEFRPRHYHAAIDIKTWQQTGYKIFAIEDGYVYRIRVASTGYGKAIYLKLKDGNFAVYAHLDGFNSALDQYTDQLRLSMKNNILDVYPEPQQFSVKKGDHIGYTGATGIGVPHLHFEIRDEQQRPLNPLQFYRDVIQDSIPPAALYLAVIPAGSQTFINFQPDTLILPVPQSSRAKIKQPVYLAGKACLALRTQDQTGGSDNLFDFYCAEMSINDSLVYTISYDRFNYDETRLIEIDKNFSLWRKGLRVYHNFYRHPANSLPFYGNTPKEGGILSGKTLREGENRIAFKVYDYSGNLLQVELAVIYNRIVPSQGDSLPAGNFKVPDYREPLFYGKWVAMKGRGRLPNSPGSKSASPYFLQYKPDAYLLSFPYDSLEFLQTPFGPDHDLRLREDISAWTPVYPGKEINIRSRDGALKLNFPPGAAYDTLYTHIRQFPARQNLKAPYRFLSDIYDVRPFDQPLNYGANLTFTLPDSAANFKGAGIYYFDRKRGWLFIPARRDNSGNSYQARVTSLEKFVIISDTVAPEVTALNLTYSPSRPLQFRARDEMSGMYRETQISIEIDGKWSLFEFDPEEDLITIHPRYIPENARGLKISATDNAGNTAIKEFRISRNGNNR